MTGGIIKPYVLFDTGPLLCFGAIKKGPRILQDRYAGHAGIVTDIDRELAGLQRNSNLGLATAARIAVRSYGWLHRHIIDDPAELAKIEQRRVELRAYRRRPNTDTVNARKDWGECATLVLAERLQGDGVVLIVANEDAARALAGRLHIPTATAVDILRALVRDAVVTNAEAFTMYRAMLSAGTDAGDIVRSAKEL